MNIKNEERYKQYELSLSICRKKDSGIEVDWEIKRSDGTWISPSKEYDNPIAYVSAGYTIRLTPVYDSKVIVSKIKHNATHLYELCGQFLDKVNPEDKNRVLLSSEDIISNIQVLNQLAIDLNKKIN